MILWVFTPRKAGKSPNLEEIWGLWQFVNVMWRVWHLDERGPGGAKVNIWGVVGSQSHSLRQLSRIIMLFQLAKKWILPCLRHLFCNFDKFILKIKNWTNARSIFIDIWTSVILSQFDVSFLLGRSWTRSCFPPQKVSSFLSLFVALTANFLSTCRHQQGSFIWQYDWLRVIF